LHDKVYIVYLAISFLACSLQINGQKTIKVSEAIGECVIANITPEEARLKAIENAKQEALRKAGVPEIINLTNILDTESSDEEFRQAFYELSSSEISGVISEFEVLQEQSYVANNGQLIKMIVISAHVKKISIKGDPEYAFSVTGIKRYYRNNEIFEFTITASRNSYARVFLIEEGNKVTMVYPNLYEQAELIPANQNRTFPINNAIEYSFFTEKNKEINNLIFVLTKQEIPFLKNVDYANIMNWIYDISPDSRLIKLHRVTILNE